MPCVKILFSFLIVVSSIDLRFQNLLYMARDAFNPSLNAFYRHSPPFPPPFRYHPASAFLGVSVYSSPLHIRPCRLNGAEIWRISRPQELRDVPEAVAFLLRDVFMRGNAILLHESISSSLLIFVYKRQQFFIKDQLAISNPVDSSLFRAPLALSTLFIPHSKLAWMFSVEEIAVYRLCSFIPLFNLLIILLLLRGSLSLPNMAKALMIVRKTGPKYKFGIPLPPLPYGLF